MSLFANYRADRLIAEVKSSGNPGSPVAQKAMEKLVALGPSAIDSIVAALNSAEKKETPLYVEALAQADRCENAAAPAQSHGGRQRPGDVGHRLGIVLQPQLSGERIARCAQQDGHAEAGHSGGDQRAEEPLHGAGAAQCRLQPGIRRACRSVQDHRRDRGRILRRRFDRANRGQGSDCAPAHHQHVGALQPSQGTGSPAAASSRTATN